MNNEMGGRSLSCSPQPGLRSSQSSSGLCDLWMSFLCQQQNLSVLRHPINHCCRTSQISILTSHLLAGSVCILTWECLEKRKKKRKWAFCIWEGGCCFLCYAAVFISAYTFNRGFKKLLRNIVGHYVICDELFRLDSIYHCELHSGLTFYMKQVLK